MPFKVKGVDVFSDDGALSKESVIAARDGTATDITGSDELLLLDGDGGDDVMRVTVDELGTKFNAVAPGGLQYTFSASNGTNSTQPGQIRLNASETIFAIHQDDRNAVLQSAFFGSIAPLTYLIYVSFDGGAGFFQGTYTDSTPDVFRFSSGTYAGVVPPDGANVEVTITPAGGGGGSNNNIDFINPPSGTFDIGDGTSYLLRGQLNGAATFTEFQNFRVSGNYEQTSPGGLPITISDPTFLGGIQFDGQGSFLDQPITDITNVAGSEVFVTVRDDGNVNSLWGWHVTYDQANDQIIYRDLILGGPSQTITVDRAVDGTDNRLPITFAPSNRELGAFPPAVQASLNFRPFGNQTQMYIYLRNDFNGPVQANAYVTVKSLFFP